MAEILRLQGKIAEAETLAVEAVAVYRAENGTGNGELEHAYSVLVDILHDRKRYSAAVEILQERLDDQRITSPVQQGQIASTLVLLGKALLATGRPLEAEPIVRECVDLRHSILPEGHWLTANAESVLGEVLMSLQRLDEAERLLLQSYPTIRKDRGAEHVRTQEAVRRIITCYDTRHTAEPDRGFAQKAVQWREKLLEPDTKGAPAASQPTTTSRQTESP